MAKMKHSFEYYVLAGLLVIAGILIALYTAQARAARAMEFPTSTYPHASVLYFGADRENAYEPGRHVTRIVVTSYNSVPEQTDATPFITAFGTEVRDGIVATNYLPRGTRVRFPDLFGNKIFVVEDRMNIRYNRHMDIWSDDKEFSRAFGARYLRMEILQPKTTPRAIAERRMEIL